MPVYDDHPIRLLMLRGNLSQERLAFLARKNRATIDKLLQGVTKRVHPDIAWVLWQHTDVPVEEIQAQVDAWNEQQMVSRLSQRAQATLLLSPPDIARFYPSFQAWRQEFAGTTSAFASMIRVNRLSVERYERGQSKRPFLPPAIHRGLQRTFGLSDEYLLALGRIPPVQTILWTSEPSTTVANGTSYVYIQGPLGGALHG